VIEDRRKAGGNALELSQKKKLTGAAIIVMSSVIVSRITGFLRTTLVVNLIKSKVEKDALFMGFTITDLMYFLLVGGAIAAALIPVLSGYLARGEEEEGWKAVGSFINVIFVGIVFLCGMGIIFSLQIVDIIAHGYESTGARELTISITRILFPSVAFMMLAGLTNGVLNSYQRFAAAAYGPTLYNMGQILSVLLLSKLGVTYVATGVMASAVIYFLFQFSFAFRNMGFYKPRIYLRHSGFLKIIKLAVPSLLASSIVQINVIISAGFTSNFRVGSVTALKNATDIWQMPYGIFAMGMGVAILPSLSERFALKDVDSFKRILLKALKTVMVLTVPSVIGIIVLGGPMVSAIYKWSAAIDANTVHTTATILVFFTLALFTQSIVAIFSRAFYAANDTKTPLFVGAGVIALNAFFCYIFTSATRLEAAGMALAYSLSSTVYAVMLVALMDKKIKGIQLGRLAGFLLKVTLASLVMGCALYFINRILPVDIYRPYNLHEKVLELFYLLIEMSAGVLVYFAAAALLKVDEVLDMFGMAADRIRRITGRLERQS